MKHIGWIIILLGALVVALTAPSKAKSQIKSSNMYLELSAGSGKILHEATRIAKEKGWYNSRVVATVIDIHTIKITYEEVKKP